MRIVLEAGQNFSAFLAARLIFITVLLGVGVFFRTPDSGLLPYLSLFAANTLLCLGGWEWYRRQRLLSVVKWLTMTLAVLLDTLLLYYVGRGDTVFVFLYFFSVGAAGLLTGWAVSAWTALLCILGLNWLAWNHVGDFDEGDGIGIFLYALNFVLIAVLSSYFHTWYRQRELAHRETLGELHQTRLDTQAILDSLSTGVLVVDQERHVIYSNPSGRRLIGASVISRNAELEKYLVTGLPFGDAMSANGDEPTTGWSREIEQTIGERRRIIGCTVTPLLNVAGNLRGQLLLLADLTPMKEAEWAERERERLAAIGMLSRDLAHQIRNPLATVRGCVEMMQTVQDKAEQRRFLDLALKESDRLNELLRDFLTFAQSESPKKQSANFTEFVRGRLPHDLPGLTYVDCLPEQLEIAMDQDQLGLVVDAVIFSLAEWADGHGEIRLEASSNGKHTIRFLLTGTTVPSEYKSAVFQPFSSANRARHGLALPTALRAVHAHGGKLTLGTETGIGTWFDLKL